MLSSTVFWSSSGPRELLIGSYPIPSTICIPFWNSEHHLAFFSASILRLVFGFYQHTIIPHHGTYNSNTHLDRTLLPSFF